MAACIEKLWAGYQFDLDGTLIDTAPDLHQALNHALASHGLMTVPLELARLWVGHGAQHMINRSLDHNQQSHANAESLRPAFLAYYAEHICVHSEPYDTVHDTLKTLAERGARLAVVTNKPKQLADQLLTTLGWADLFDCVVGGDTAAAPKPAADPIYLACEQMRVPSSDILFVGDSATDVGAARAASVPVVCMRDGYNEGIDAEKLGADAVIDQFSELLT